MTLQLNLPIADTFQPTIFAGTDGILVKLSSDNLYFMGTFFWPQMDIPR